VSMARPRRSIVYRLGDDPTSYDTAKDLAVDVLLFDLEDSVSPADKTDARSRMGKALAAGNFNGQERLIRINGLDTKWGAEDLAFAAKAPIDGIMLCKVETGRQMKEADDALGGMGAPDSLRLWAMIETPKGVLAAEEIAASTPRMEGIAIGLGDLSRGMGGFRRAAPFRFPMLTALSTIAMVAKAHGLAAIDSSFRDARDPEGFRAACLEGRELGYDGKAVGNQEQAAIADAAFGPTAQEIEWSKRVLAAVKAAPEGKQVKVDGQLIEPGYLDVARQIAEMAKWPRLGA
jgi:citrate lyase subunit beta/citryl-CoA lyase